MIIYTSKPKQHRARKAWEYFTNKYGKEPEEMWFNPNCWSKPQMVGNAWGFWIAKYNESGCSYGADSGHKYALPSDF